MSFKNEVRELLRAGGVTARLSSPSGGWVLLDDSVAVVRSGPGKFSVLLVDPVSEAYEEHGAYNDLRVALSEAVEHLVRFRLIGEHVSADMYATAGHGGYEMSGEDLRSKRIDQAWEALSELDRDGQAMAVLNLGRADLRALRRQLDALPWS